MSFWSSIMGKSSTTQVQASDPWIPTQATANKFNNFADGALQSGFTDSLANSQSILNGLNTGTSGAVTNGYLDSQQTQYADGFIDTLNQYQDPEYNAASLAALKSNVTDDVMAGVNSTFGGSGMTGSSLHQQNLASGLASGLASVENDFMQSAADRALTAATTGQNALESNLNRALSATSGLNSAENASFTNGLNLSTAQQSLGTAEQTAFQNALSTYLNAASGNASQSVTNTSNPGFLETAGTVASVASLFSDERLKEDIKPVGSLDTGETVYTYKYKDGVMPALDGKTLMGVMAQEVEKRRKGAVTTDKASGYKQVDYGKLG